ncbi:uncharacterized protein E5676_scaffold109G00020 [Cucumis melo var. makuwa]|uniref:Uncharacterized protein n=1 Tax=Cucumis melo var. makuwa TaxID=1194695 RepID=A0A5D3BPP8_CUCMM|nr:uncharacterized protein E6C27_scaffold43056G00050 [Cucumis melo var. makuwa]TYK01135.1 uncharacterized protein E5676_scaffold109G00020 [Cucumis melo var. makuwa]
MLMAIDVCSEISTVGISPRISFSHDLNQTDLLPSSNCDRDRDRLDLSLLESDFDFCIGNLLLQDLSSADELFSNGKILPKSIEPNRQVLSKPNQSHRLIPPIPPDPSRNSVSSEKKSLKELLSASFDGEEKQQSKSFWQFKRSSSLNCESSKSRSLIRSLHFLSRSNSTGSVLNPKQQSNSKDCQRPNLQKQASISSSRRSSSSSSSSTSFSNSYFANTCSQKHSMRKNFGWNNGNGVGISSSPLLNLPPPYISKVTIKKMHMHDIGDTSTSSGTDAI